MTGRAWWRLGGLVALLGLLASVLPVALSWSFRQSDVTTSPLAGVTRLAVSSGTGDVVVRVAREGETPAATARSSYALGAPDISAEVVDGVATLHSTCSRWSVTCRVVWDVIVPADTDVEISLGTGDVTACDLTGSVHVEAGIGVVDLCRLGSDTAYVRTGTGGAVLDFRVAPDQVGVDTGVGDVTVTLPPGDSYAVRTVVGVGSTTNDLATDATAPRTVDVTVGVGDVSLLAR